MWRKFRHFLQKESTKSGSLSTKDKGKLPLVVLDDKYIILKTIGEGRYAK